jgi:hypothetical protein
MPQRVRSRLRETSSIAEGMCLADVRGNTWTTRRDLSITFQVLRELGGNLV